MKRVELLEPTHASDTLRNRFTNVRDQSEMICAPLEIEDFSAQPEAFVSPPKWHLAHTTWFWEEFILVPHHQGYQRFDKDFNYYWNSYYNFKGKRVRRDSRGQLTRPTVREIMLYRKAIDSAMKEFLGKAHDDHITHLIEVGLQHEEQHQELLLYDIKFILGHQPGFPVYDADFACKTVDSEAAWCTINEGVYEIGHHGKGFCFDNELGRHKEYLVDAQLKTSPVTNAEYLDFVEAGGYARHELWHDEGWKWVQESAIDAPLYWHLRDSTWFEFDLNGMQTLQTDKAVQHISFYEASAFAAWKDLRLPTEAEWEIAAGQLDHGHAWEWTASAYSPYPGFKKAPGALGEYNGKFMINQMVLRGSSIATPPGHSRVTYRNFFHPNMRWQCAGLRLAK